jgi:hypothetical protein
MRVSGLLKDKTIDGKQGVRKNARQNDVGDEWQDDGDSKEGDEGEDNPEEDAFLFQWSLPYVARAPKTV